MLKGREVKKAIKALTRKQLELIATRAYFGIYENPQTGALDADHDVSGADYVQHMQVTLSDVGIPIPVADDEADEDSFL